MPIEYADSSAEIRLIKLSGRLDIAGTGEIETQFAALAATEKRGIIVDLTAVDFLASICIRSIISNAKAQQQRGGRMVLVVGENQFVAKTLQTTGIDVLVPMFVSLEDAKGALSPS